MREFVPGLHGFLSFTDAGKDVEDPHKASSGIWLLPVTSLRSVRWRFDSYSSTLHLHNLAPYSRFE